MARTGATTAAESQAEERSDGFRSLLPDDFLDAVRGHEARLDLDLLALAFQYSKEKHAGQKRRSGADYITHCVEVAKILSEIHLDTVSIAASLLHDVVEDTGTSVEEIRQEFGSEIATIVDGLTKISRVEIGSLAERQVETYRKLLLSMARDARVIIVKLADRLHNMRTLEPLPAGQQRRIAQETRDIYGPLAHRLGMARVRWELEDLAFKYLEPEEYRSAAETVAEKRSEREEKDEHRHYTERSYGSFSRSVRLPADASDDVAAKFKDGVLTIEIPKVAEKKPRTVSIQS